MKAKLLDMPTAKAGAGILENINIIKEVLLCSANLVLFAYLAEYPFPVKTAAFVPLIFVAAVIGNQININAAAIKQKPKNIFRRGLFKYYIVAVQIGIIGGLAYRGSFYMPLLPTTVNGFIFIAALIGLTEELVFRGYMQSRLAIINQPVAIFLAALAHALYKTFLFLSPAALPRHDLLHFFLWTLIASVIVGLLKQTSKSIIPAIIAHIVFDMIVYAEMTHAPWWVW